ERVPFTQYLQQPKVQQFKLDKSFTVADGVTAVFSGMRIEREVANEDGPPILSKVPYVNRLFKNVGHRCEGENVLVMVTPHIIVNSEAEQCIPPIAAAKSVIPAAHHEVCRSPERAQKEEFYHHLVDLKKKYQQACEEGRKADATALAV